MIHCCYDIVTTKKEASLFLIFVIVEKRIVNWQHFVSWVSGCGFDPVVQCRMWMRARPRNDAFASPCNIFVHVRGWLFDDVISALVRSPGIVEHGSVLLPRRQVARWRVRHSGWIEFLPQFCYSFNKMCVFLKGWPSPSKGMIGIVVRFLDPVTVSSGRQVDNSLFYQCQMMSGQSRVFRGRFLTVDWDSSSHGCCRLPRPLLGLLTPIYTHTRVWRLDVGRRDRWQNLTTECEWPFRAVILGVAHHFFFEVGRIVVDNDFERLTTEMLGAVITHSEVYFSFLLCESMFVLIS